MSKKDFLILSLLIIICGIIILQVIIMNRVFLKLGPITIYWYAVLIVLAICIGIYFSTKEAKKNGLGRDFLMDLIFYVIPIGILGARLYYVIFNFSVFKDNLLDIFKIWEGGLAIYGAVISGIIFVVYYCKKHSKNILLTIDTIVPYLILGQAIGRWGNFINKEAHGAVTTLGHLESLHLPNFIINGMYINGNYYIPTFLYESLWCLLGFIVLLIIRKKDKYKHNGLLVSSYFIWYGIGRLFIEGLRTDSLYLGVFRISQIVSIILILIGITGIIYIRRKSWKNTK